MLSRKTYTIQEMFDSVNKIVCNLSGYPPVNKLLREYPDGSRVLDEGYSPFLSVWRLRVFFIPKKPTPVKQSLKPASR